MVLNGAGRRGRYSVTNVNNYNVVVVEQGCGTDSGGVLLLCICLCHQQWLRQLFCWHVSVVDS